MPHVVINSSSSLTASRVAARHRSIDAHGRAWLAVDAGGQAHQHGRSRGGLISAACASARRAIRHDKRINTLRFHRMAFKRLSSTPIKRFRGHIDKSGADDIAEVRCRRQAMLDYLMACQVALHNHHHAPPSCRRATPMMPFCA